MKKLLVLVMAMLAMAGCATQPCDIPMTGKSNDKTLADNKVKLFGGFDNLLEIDTGDKISYNFTIGDNANIPGGLIK